MRKVLFFSFSGLMSLVLALLVAALGPDTLAQTSGGDGSSCLACHSDAERLEALAEEVVLPRPPSEGSG